jgi:hypothetical protein
MPAYIELANRKHVGEAILGGLAHPLLHAPLATRDAAP